MANTSGPLTVVEMQAIRLAITEERIFKMFLVLSTHAVFIYINIVMLFTLRTKATFRETSRYILFAHMLLNDTIHLVVGLVLYVLGAFYLVIVRAICAFIVLMSASTFINAPLNLAVMSLERYTAICFPLRHSELATPMRTRVAVVVVWALGVFNVLTDVFALFLLAEPSFYLSHTVCTIEQLLVAPWQRGKGVALNTLLFVAVMAVLLYTYVAILKQARAASTDHSSAQKALRTVLLHALQLGLSLMSFLYVQLEFLLGSLPLPVYTQLRFLNFFMVLILPRCLSSLIYGLRDETFRPLFRQYVLFCSAKKLEPL
ncbi:odorant receptor 131-2-like [Colossoma macropomum]|uniref:odorant receptor 131-2-like n=1 Tax=Colossoma macropomum TaxID=42526 RepID=UPI00186524D8|nr:odorant receptor 131-2-like [Colossoma macropomum]